jgi:hypothetical protein
LASSPRETCEIQESSTSDLDYFTDGEDWSNLENDEAVQCGRKVWVDDVEGFETKVLQAVGYDLKAGASLIPQLYSTLRHKNSSAVGFWGTKFKHCPGHSGSSPRNSPHTQGASGSSSNSNGKKHSYQDGSDEDFGENRDGDDQEDREQNPKRARTNSTEAVPRFACPFHKWKPVKYDAFYKADEVGHPRYKTCQGPGFSSIARLK